MLLRCKVNHRIPSASNTAVCGSRGRGIGHRIDGDFPGGRVELADRSVLVAGVPDHARVIDRDRVRHGVGRQRVFLHLAGRRIDAPDQVAPLAAHQMVPSGASTGSRARWPSVGTVHSVNPILSSPGTSLGRARRVRRHVGSQVPGNLRPLLRHVGKSRPWSRSARPIPLRCSPNYARSGWHCGSRCTDARPGPCRRRRAGWPAAIAPKRRSARETSTAANADIDSLRIASSRGVTVVFTDGPSASRRRRSNEYFY